MSTAPKPIPPSTPDPQRRQSTTKSAARSSSKSKRKPPVGGASFDYGWRYVRTKRADGGIDFDMVPLTLEDVLHPKFGDVHVLTDAHDDDCNYLKDVLKDRYQGDPSVVVLSDTGIFWDVPGLKNHSPDLAVIFNVKERKEWITFLVKTEKVRPRLIIEVTSPKTRVNDLERKVAEYAQAQVPYYVIVDPQQTEKRRRITLIAYELIGADYHRQVLDEQGRAWLEPVGLWLGVREDPQTGGDGVALFDPVTGQQIGDYVALSRARAEAEARADQATVRADQATVRADQAEARAAAEAAARFAAEEQVRLIEAELRRLRGEQ
jgi:colicin import membrane protein